MKRATSLRMIAEETGLAIGTISRILSGKDQCAPETRDRVLEAARKMSYHPNQLARAMHTGRTLAVGVINCGWDEFFTAIARGIHDVLTGRRYLPICVSAKSDPSDDAGVGELDLIHRLIEQRVDGVILRPTADSVTDNYLHEVWERRLPLVAVDRRLTRTRADFVGTDDETGGRLAAEHLLELGHRRLGHLAGADEVTTARLRRQGFEQAVAEVPGATCETVPDPSFHDGAGAARCLLQMDPPPTAIFAANDYEAASVYRVAGEMDLSVPGDLSVVGFSDLPLARMLTPPLTTIHQDPRRIGMQAARLMLDRLDGKLAEDQPRSICLRPHLVVRESTAPPAETAD